MGPVLLTVAIPTYNRAALLERQLCWLAGAIGPHAADVEVLVSDNASTDDTAAVVERVAPAFRRCRFVVRRHEHNVGAIRNIASCIRDARGRHVWVVSDDDRVADDAVAHVVGTLRHHPDLALLALDFSSRTDSGGTVFERCFDVGDDRPAPDGAELFTRCVARRPGNRWGGLALTTALVYRADLARQALDAWPEGLDNLVVQLYWTAYCAVRGPTLFTRRAFVECRAGGHHFLDHPLTYLQLKSADASEVFARLATEGVAPGAMARKLVERPGAFLPLVPRCARQAPGPVARLLARYVRALVVGTSAAALSPLRAPLRPRPLPAPRPAATRFGRGSTSG